MNIFQTLMSSDAKNSSEALPDELLLPVALTKSSYEVLKWDDIYLKIQLNQLMALLRFLTVNIDHN